MKKVIVITCILVLVVMAMSAAMATEIKWALRVYGSDTTARLSGGIVNSSGGYAAFGVAQTAGNPFAYSGQGGYVSAGSLDADGKLYTMVSKPNLSTWTVYVAANSLYTPSTLRISIGTATSANFLPSTVGGEAVRYAVAVNDVFQSYLTVPATAPASGTELWYGDFATVKGDLSAGPAGYKLTVTQEYDVPDTVPEPSSMLALGSGLVGLVGFVSRRRRA